MIQESGPIVFSHISVYSVPNVYSDLLKCPKVHFVCCIRPLGSTDLILWLFQPGSPNKPSSTVRLRERKQFVGERREATRQQKQRNDMGWMTQADVSVKLMCFRSALATLEGNAEDRRVPLHLMETAARGSSRKCLIEAKALVFN